MSIRRTIQHSLLILLGIVLVELVLQGVSWILYVNQKTDYLHQQQLSLATKQDKRVLCVGDSFTQGIGASSRAMSYPDQLQEILNVNSKEDRWEVVNFGRNGSDSWQLLYYLDTWIRRVQPSYVCLLIGMNDNHRSEYVDKVTDRDGRKLPQSASLLQWVWKWRTRYFARLLVRSVRATAQPDVGSAVVMAGASRKSLRIDRVVDDETGPSTSQLLRMGKRMLRYHDAPEKAEGIFKQVLADGPDHHMAQLGLAEALTRQNKYDEAEELLDAIERDILAAENAFEGLVARTAAQYMRNGNWESARELCDWYLQRHPKSVQVLLRLADIAAQTDNRIEAMRYIDTSLLYAPSDPAIYSKRAILKKSWGELEGSLDDVLTVYQLSSNRQTYHTLSGVYAWGAISSGTFERVLRASTLNKMEQDDLWRMFQRVIAEQDSGSFEAHFATNLQRIAQICERHHVQLILINYYHGEDFYANRQLRMLHTKTGLPLIDVSAHLGDMMITRELPLGDFLAADSHLNDHGYREMAELVAEHLLGHRAELTTNPYK